MGVIDELRAFLEADEVLERLRGDEDERDALLDLLPGPRDLSPHIVKLAAARVKDGAHVGPLVCPDCTRGLYSRGGSLTCSRVPADHELVAKRAGYIVACGGED